MGLLTTSGDSQRGKWLADMLTRPELSLLAYVAGVAWLGLLAWEPASTSTYFSENALLPGVVNRDFSLSTLPLEPLEEEARSHPAGLPYAWLLAQFRQMGLETYTHNFTLNYPFGNQPKYQGKNMYAILRAPRTASVEALVLSSPYRSYDSLHGNTLPGIALMLELANFFRKRTFWAKDLIFLITEHELVGMQAWLEAYHGSCHNPQVLECGTLEARSGAIQAAIHLELGHEKATHLDLAIEGVNGQLPNLDLVNLAVELAMRENVPILWHGAWYQGPWETTFPVLASAMAAQASGLPTAAHGLFSPFSIQALTLRTGIHPGIVYKRSMHNFGRVVEGMLRSLNNLLERFHQSYFFYILPSTSKFVSIGHYMIPFSLLAIPALLKAFAIYLALGEEASKELEAKAQKDPASLLHRACPSLWPALVPSALCHLGGLATLHLLPYSLSLVPELLGVPLEDAAQLSVAVWAALLLVALPLVYSPLRREGRRREALCVALLELGALLFTLSLMNISQAYLLAVLYIPVVMLVSTSSKPRLWRRVLQALLLLPLHPLVASALGVWAGAGGPWRPAMAAHARLLLFSLEDWWLYANWNLPIVCSVLFPIWMQLWALT